MKKFFRQFIFLIGIGVLLPAMVLNAQAEKHVAKHSVKHAVKQVVKQEVKPVDTVGVDASGTLINLLQNIKSMQANFTQTLLTPGRQSMNPTKGNMALQRPGKFRWQTITPNQQLFVADGNFVWVYDVTLQQVTKQKQSQVNPTNPASLLTAAATDLPQRFAITTMPNAKTGQWFELTPHDRGEALQDIQLQFKNNQLTQMKIQDNLGGTTVVLFSQIQVNAPLSSSLFNFTPPAGVDVIKQ